MTANLYRAYLAADLAQKRLAAVGLTHGNITLDLADSFRNTDSENSQGIPYAWVWPVIRLTATGFDFPEEIYSNSDWESRADEEQPYREAKLLELVKLFPDVKVFRDGSVAYIYFDALSDIGVNISFGRALCERVAVGTRTVMRPAEDAPLVPVEETVFEWRCNDAELGVAR